MLPPLDRVVVNYGSRNATLVEGWVNQPNGRGTIDILWACAFTVFLSSWSILCLNLPAENEGFWRQARRKIYWTLLIVMGPEIVLQLSLGEWIQARCWTQEFQKLGYQHWGLIHSFFANMGGFVLQTPDEGSFPINAAQLHYLVSRGYVQCPAISKKKILDKNKAAKVVRFLTLCQVCWFLVSCIARVNQGLALSTIELSTIAFVLSAAGTFFCWYHKPMDVETPEHVDTITPIAEIKRSAGVAANADWLRTPLDFIDAKREWPWNLYWHYGLAMIKKLTGMPWLVLHPKCRPFERLPDDYWPEPTIRSLPTLFVFHVGYAAILMAGWNLELPTRTELLLWRISTSIQLGTILSGWATMPLQIQDTPPQLQKLFSFASRERERFRTRKDRIMPTMRKWYSRGSITEEIESRADKARTLINQHPHWKISLRLLLVYQVTWCVYLVTRLYIVVEDVVSLRALPVTAFTSVNWSTYLPHL